MTQCSLVQNTEKVNMLREHVLLTVESSLSANTSALIPLGKSRVELAFLYAANLWSDK
jgi:hypothetical protein